MNGKKSRRNFIIALDFLFMEYGNFCVHIFFCSYNFAYCYLNWINVTITNKQTNMNLDEMKMKIFFPLSKINIKMMMILFPLIIYSYLICIWNLFIEFPAMFFDFFSIFFLSFFLIIHSNSCIVNGSSINILIYYKWPWWMNQLLKITSSSTSS